MTHASRTAAALLGAVSLATVLAACGGPTGPIPSDSPAPSVSPSGSATAQGAGDGLPSATDATCDDLVPPGSLASLFSTPLEPVGPTRTPAHLATVLDDSWVAEAAGGLACDWQDPDSTVSSEVLAGFYRGVRLLLAPAPHAGFEEFSHLFTDPGDDVNLCGDGSCSRDAYINGWWLSLSASEFESEEYQAHAWEQFDAIIARVRALPAPRTIAHDSTLTDDCSVLLPADRFAHTFDVTPDQLYQESEFQLSFRDTVLAQLGGMSCYLEVDGTDVGNIQTLPGGAWAERAAVAAYLEAGGVEQQIAIPGVAVPGSLRQQDGRSSFDFVINNDWIKVILPAGPYPPENAAFNIANAIVGAYS